MALTEPPVRGLLFDLFHTLTGRESEWSEQPPTYSVLGVDPKVWNRALLESSRWRLVGEERDPWTILRRLVTIIDPRISDETVRNALNVRTKRFTDVFQNIPRGNLETLKRLRAAGFRLALLSNADAMEISLYATGPLAGLFDVEVFSCDVGCAKPEPEIFHACLEQLGLPASDCVFIGDGGSDELQGAKAVGLRTVFVSGVIEELFPEYIEPRRAVADHHVRFISEVLPLLELTCLEESTPA